jgi:hypothetical protein
MLRQLAEPFFILVLGCATFIVSPQFLPWLAGLGVGLMTIDAPDRAYWEDK